MDLEKKSLKLTLKQCWFSKLSLNLGIKIVVYTNF